ncbi:MAG: polysaccharide deacetylase [Alphaproteobacteria bacterium]|nr:MAG: polysaccharide deacetylase [Alphaproteobacteria bacterium]
MKRFLLPILALLAAAPAPAAPPLQMAITMDDLPVHGPLPPGETRLDVARRILKALRAARVPEVYGFLNAHWLESEPETEAVLREWRRAGYPLGNHGWSHQGLGALSVADYEAEIARDEPLLKRLANGSDWRWYRYPFLDEGADAAKRAEVRRYLASNGYRIAQVTMSYGDYEYNEAYARCLTAPDADGLKRLEAGYMESVRSAVDYARAASRAAYGRDIPYVLLTHISPMNARMFPKVLAYYKAQGFRFVTLAQAERDPAYRADVDPTLPPSPPVATGPLPKRYDPRPLLESVCLKP